MNNLVKQLDEQIEIDKNVIELSPKSGVKQNTSPLEEVLYM